jgi:hypothetical protein
MHRARFKVQSPKQYELELKNISVLLIQTDQRLPAKNTTATNPAYTTACAPMYCDPAPDFVSVAARLLVDDGPALVDVPFATVVELPYTPVGELVGECEDEVEVIVEFEEDFADGVELDGVGIGIPLYNSA